MKPILTFFISILFAGITVAQTPITVGEKYVLHSDILEGEREVWIGLPQNFEAEKSYPVIYVMDAEWQFDYVLSVSKELAATDKIPAHIVVGIPKIDWRHRCKDLTFSTTQVNSAGESDPQAANAFNEKSTGGGLDFLRHLQEEVVPMITDKYATNGFDVFVGHSLSGYYGAYILTLNTTFNAFQLYDPSIWYNNGDAIDHFIRTKKEGFNTNVFIATAGGGEDRQQFNIDTHERMHQTLSENGVQSEWTTYEKEDHGSVRLIAFIDGMSQLYEGYSIGYIFPTDTITVLDAQRHYQAFSDKVNYTFECPTDAYRWIGFANHFQGKWEEALKAYELCAKAFAKDAVVNAEMADCYFQVGELDKSLEYYQNALALQPEESAFQTKLEEVKALLKEKGQD